MIVIKYFANHRTKNVTFSLQYLEFKMIDTSCTM